mgnify:FL=1
MRTFFVIMALVVSQCFHAQKIIYFDSEWNEIKNKKEASYYREVAKQGELYLIKDYYINGTLQMEGTAVDDTPNQEVFEGKVTWYFPDGKVEMVSNFKNGNLLGESKLYNANGKLLQDIVYDGRNNYSGTYYSYIEDGNVNNMISTIQNSEPTKTIYYDKSPQGIRYEIIYKKGYEEQETKYYGEGGKYLGSYKGYDDMNGVSVEYSYQPMRVASVAKYQKGQVIENKIYHDNGTLKQEFKRSGKNAWEKTYDANGKKIAELTYKQEGTQLIPYDGEQVVFPVEPSDSETITTTYSKGKFVKIEQIYGDYVTETFYDGSGQDVTEVISKKNGEEFAKLVYRDGVPYNGMMRDAVSEQQYKEGRLMSEKIFKKGKISSEKKYLENKDAYEVKIFNEDILKFVYIAYSEAIGYFSAEITPYDDKGKALPKVIVKEGFIEKGKLTIDCYCPEKKHVTYERKGDWIIKQSYNKAGMYRELKVKIDKNQFNSEIMIDEYSLANGTDTDELVNWVE